MLSSWLLRRPWSTPRRQALSKPVLELLEDRLCPAWTVTDLGTGQPWAINEASQVVGRDGSGAFLWEDGVKTYLESVPDGGSYAHDINDSGQVVGTVFLPWFGGFLAPSLAALWQDGALTDVSFYTPSIALAINNTGQIVGYGEDADGDDLLGWLLENDQHLILGDLLPPGSPQLSGAIDINDRGQIIAWGSSRFFLLADDDGLFANGGLTATDLGAIAGSFEARLNNIGQVVFGSSFYSNGVTTNLGFTGRGINDAGQVVGSGQVTGLGTRAFFWQNGQAIDLNTFLDPSTGWVLQHAADINQHGEIVGHGTIGGQQRTFLLSPSSEPILTISPATASEGDSGTTGVTFTVSLSAPTDQAVTVTYATANGSATAGSDYEASAGTLTFEPGETSKTITALVLGDTHNEGNETFLVNLGTPTNALLGQGQATGTILDDDPLPAITINDLTLTEGHTGTRNATFTVSLSFASTQTVTVNWTTANGTATAPSDYQAVSGILTFDPGQTTRTVTVLVKGDRVAEPNETFLINLSGASNATIGDGQGIGTILDDEPRISISDVSRLEGKKGQKTIFTFTVTLSAAYDQAVAVAFRTVNGTATAGNGDYVGRSGTLTFKPGETQKSITIVVNGDSKQEADETFFVDLSGASSNALLARKQGIGTIFNDDFGSLLFRR
jgi:probable HAF family extracellular repeat protein